MLYFPKSTIQRINNCFNLCLYKLFGFKPDINDLNRDIFYNEIDQQEEVMENFSLKLQKYNLCTFQERLIKRFLIFTHSILNNVNAPPELKTIINLTDSSIDDPIIGITRFHLRGRAPIKHIVPNTKYDHLTFRFFFPRLISKINTILDINAKAETFQTLIDNNISGIRKIFLETFSRFDVSARTWRGKQGMPKKDDNLLS